MRYIIICNLIFSFFLKEEMVAQSHSIFSGSVPNENAIEIKWFTKSPQLDEAFDLYRSDAGKNNWVKLNQEPIKRAKPLSEAEIEAMSSSSEKSLVQYSAAFLDEPKEHLNNYSLLLISSIMDNPLAELCGIYFKDKTISISQSYDYKLTKAGSNSEIVGISGVRYNANYSGKAVENFAGKSGNKIAVFNWSHDMDNPIYRIYRGTRSNNYDSSFLIFPTMDNLEASKAGKMNYEESLTPISGNTYYYSIVGIDHFGRESKKSQEVAIKVIDLTPPPAILGLRATYDEDGFIKLNWIRPHSLVKSYKLYKSNIRQSGYTEILIGLDTFVIDKLIEEGQSYYYFMEAKNEFGISSYTDTILCAAPDFTPPSIPKNFRASSDSGHIYLSWDMNTEGDLAGYLLFRALSTDSKNFVPVFADPMLGITYTDELPKEAGNYFIYKICAMDKSYNRSEMSSPIFERMPNVIPPKPSEISELEYENGAVNIAWTRNLEPDFFNYEVYRGDEINDTTFGNYRMIYSTREAFYTDKTVEDKKTYSYYIVTRDSSNNSTLSSTRTIRVENTVQSEAPRNLNLAASDNSIHIKWSSGRQNVQVYKKQEGGNYFPITPIISAESFVDEDISKGKVYVYKIVSLGEEEISSEEKRIEF